MSSSESKFGLAKFLLDIPPAVLYHYTSMEGLLGIVQSGKIRASDSRFLNDRTDSTYLFEILRTRIPQRIINTTGADRKYYEDLLAALEKTTIFDVFVASFSEDGDSLSQWRAYSPGGIGFSIGVEPKTLRRGYVSDPFEPHFVFERFSRVRYLSDAPDTSLDEILKAAENWVELVSKANIPISPVDFTAGSLSVSAPTFKHNSFAEEREWRLILRAYFINSASK